MSTEKFNAEFSRFADWCKVRGFSRSQGYRLRRAGLLEVSYLGSTPIITREAEQRLLERATAHPTSLTTGHQPEVKS